MKKEQEITSFPSLIKLPINRIKTSTSLRFSFEKRPFLDFSWSPRRLPATPPVTRLDFMPIRGFKSSLYFNRFVLKYFHYSPIFHHHNSLSRFCTGMASAMCAGVMGTSSLSYLIPLRGLYPLLRSGTSPGVAPTLSHLRG